MPSGDDSKCRRARRIATVYHTVAGIRHCGRPRQSKRRVSVERVAFLLGIRPGNEGEYKRRHDEIWPEMVEALHRAGARNYSIFFDTDRTRLFAYLEAEPNFATFRDRINADPVNARWQEYMKE